MTHLLLPSQRRTESILSSYLHQSNLQREHMLIVSTSDSSIRTFRFDKDIGKVVQGANGWGLKELEDLPCPVTAIDIQYESILYILCT